MLTSLTTTDLILRPFSLNDVQCIFHLSQEKSLGKWIPDQVYKDEQQAREVLVFLIAQYQFPINPSLRPFVLALETKAGQLIGHVGLSSRGDSVEIGYAIGEAYVGKGFATQAVECLSKWATANLNLNKLIAIVACENIGSCRVLEKAGYSFKAELEMPYLGKVRKCREYNFSSFSD
jgi:RimJ/RimL family protein N-acetyltransferase